jgi:predicted nucleic acid-binding Zn ribbon protein
MSPRRPRGQPERVGGLVARVLGDLGLDASARVVRLSERWEEAVGREVASHCRPTALYGEDLEVTADSSAWCQQVSLRRVEILSALRRVAGADAPSGLRFRVGGTGEAG